MLGKQSVGNKCCSLSTNVKASLIHNLRYSIKLIPLIKYILLNDLKSKLQDISLKTSRVVLLQETT